MLTDEIRAAIDDAKTSTSIRTQKIFQSEIEYVALSNKNTPVILADALEAADAENERLRRWIQSVADDYATLPYAFQIEAKAILRGEKVSNGE
jgi:hypothetical protein